MLVIATTPLPVDATRAFDFHADAQNLPLLMPGPVRVLSAPRPTRQGDVQVIEIGRRPFAVRWQARIERVDPPYRIVDVQERGPFRFWRHTHAVLPAGRGSVLVDMVEFRLVPGRFGRVVDALVVGVALHLVFRIRHGRSRRFMKQGPRR